MDVDTRGSIERLEELTGKEVTVLGEGVKFDKSV
jgi:hypothetical protein